MNGIHDVGGMQGFGALPLEENEPVFHEQWERDVFSVIGSYFSAGMCSLDEFRHSIELMDPAAYLCTPYYAHWLFAAEWLGVRHGLFTPEELEAKMQELGSSEVKPS